MSDNNEDEDYWQGDEYSDEKVRATFLRADYDVTSQVDRRRFAEDMYWVRGRRRYWTARKKRSATIWVWLLTTIGAAVVTQTIQFNPIAFIHRLLEGGS